MDNNKTALGVALTINIMGIAVGLFFYSMGNIKTGLAFLIPHIVLIWISVTLYRKL